MKNRKPLLIFAALALCAALSPTAQADPITLSINNTAIGFSGDLLTFKGTLTNLGPPTVFLNSLSFTFPTGFTVDVTPFFLLPPSLTAAQSTGLATIFTVTIGAVPQGVYLSSITILGGATATSLNSLITRDFQITVVPEPATLLLVGSALALASRRRRRRRTGRLPSAH